MSVFIDTHFHLDYYKNHCELYKQINNLQQYTVCMTNSPGIYYSLIHLYNSSKYIRFALGFHPQMHNLTFKDFEEFKYLFNNCKYIGEVGLDFSLKYKLNNTMQIKCFDEIIKMCAEQNKIVSVHLRKDKGEGIRIIEKYKPKKCIIHWFSGAYDELKRLISLNCYFSINEHMILNTKRNKWLLEIPLEKVLIESDGPFTKVNGKKYTPGLLNIQYQNISKFLNQPDLVYIVYKNFAKLLSE